jgi:hypothetical protein
MKTVKIDLTKTAKQADGTNKRVPTGVSLEVPVYSVAEFTAHSEAAAQFVEDAVEAAILAKARNAGTQATVAMTIDAIIATAERSGAALAVAREFITDFTAYLATKSGKSAAVQALYTGMVKARATIALSSEARRLGLAAQLEQFVGELDAEGATKYQNILTTLNDLCSGTVELDDSDL